MAKFIDDTILKPTLPRFTKYTVKDTFEFCTRIRNMKVEDHEALMSYDVSSLFTNIPLEETITIICDTWEDRFENRVIDKFGQLVICRSDHGKNRAEGTVLLVDFRESV